MILMKTKTFRSLAMAILIGLPMQLLAQTDYWADLVYFSGCPVNHIPKGIGIPDRSPEARAVMNAIIGGATYSDLKVKLSDSLDAILGRLEKGNVIRRQNEKIQVLFPILTGEKREKLNELVKSKIRERAPSIDSLIAPLRKELKDNPHLVFHFLWSRVIDNCWWELYNREFHTKKGPPSIAWIIYPPHPFQCGTNYDQTSNNSQIAISWSYNIFDEFFTLPPTAAFYSLAKHDSLKDKDREFFMKYGLMGPDNTSLLFTYPAGCRLDLLCDSLNSAYAAKIRGMFDYRSLGEEYGIPASELFIIVVHEVAYNIFQVLSEEKKDLFIPILLESNPLKNFSWLCSFRME
jgi:hypothetical protein